MAIIRVTAQWSGFTGAPGYSNFHFSGPATTEAFALQRDVVGDFFTAMKASFPQSLRVNIANQGEVYAEGTGELTGYVDDPTSIPAIGGSTGTAYAGPVGGVVNWNTNTVHAGRRVRGRTFIVPLNTTSFDAEGSLSAAAIGNLQSGALLLVGSAEVTGFGVWSRPQNGVPGTFAPVTSSRVPDLAAVLRSRRD